MDVVDQAATHSETYLNFVLAGNASKIKNLESPRDDRSPFCIDCGEEIPAQRLKIFPGALRCVKCQEKFERG